MAHLSEQNDEIAEINMTPFVDIVLVILVIFMVTATFVSQGKIPLHLPEASTTEIKQEEQTPVILSLNQMGEFYYDDLLLSIEEMELRIASLENKNQMVILRSDAQTPFEHVVKLIDLCKKYRITSFAIQTAYKH